MPRDKLTDLLAAMETVGDAPDLQRPFEMITETYGLSTVAYLGAGIGKERRRDETFVAGTYRLNWIERYKAEHYVTIDPVVQIGMRQMLPIDWRNFGSTSEAVRRLFGEAMEFGVGRQGLSIPIHGRHGDKALFSVTSNANDVDWRRLRNQFTRDFQLLAMHVHAMLLELEGTPIPDVKLSPRERECLLWISEGKTAWECSVILGLSHHTVRCYLESARHKLEASSNTHAVAKATKAGLLLSIP